MAAQLSPSAEQTRSIAEEAYIYGFPLVDEYLTMYAFSVDKKNPQYKGPFNSILNFAISNFASTPASSDDARPPVAASNVRFFDVARISEKSPAAGTDSAPASITSFFGKSTMTSLLTLKSVIVALWKCALKL